MDTFAVEPDDEGSATLKRAELGQPNGVASLDENALLPVAQLPVEALRTSQRGNANGVASLDETTRLPVAQLPVEALRTAQRGAANGVASLDADGKVPASQLPSTASGVSSFKGRTGTVTPANGDYSAAQVGADPAGTAEAAIEDHLAAENPHPQYLTRAQTDALYISAGGSGSGSPGATTWFNLSGGPRTMVANEEVSIAHAAISNAQMIPVVMVRQDGATDVTNLNINYDLETASQYNHQNSAKTQVDVTVRLMQQDPGAFFACNFNNDFDSVYGQLGTGGNGASTTGGNAVLSGTAHVAWPDFPQLTLGTRNWCIEAILTPTALPGGRTGLLFQTNGGGYQAKWFWVLVPIDATHAIFGVHTNGPGYPTYELYTDTFQMVTNQSYHLVMQRNGLALEWFVNGSQITIGGQSSFAYGNYSWPDCSANLFLGANGDYVQTFLQANVSAVRIRSGSFPLYTDGYTVPSSPFVGPNYDTSATGWWVKTGTALRLDLSMVDRLDYIIATASEPEGTAIRFLLSFDGGTTWKANTGSGWTVVAPADAQTGGMNTTQLQAATTALDVSALASLDVLVSLRTLDANVTPTVDQLTIRYDEKAAYSPAPVGPYGWSQAFGMKHWSTVTKLKNQTNATQTVIAYVVKNG